MDVKTLNNGRRSSNTKGFTYESAVTESVYKRKRSVAKDAQEEDLCEVAAGSGIRDEEQQGRAQTNGGSRHLAVLREPRAVAYSLIVCRAGRGREH